MSTPGHPRRPPTQEKSSRLGTPGRPSSGASHGSDELQKLAQDEEADQPRELKSVSNYSCKVLLYQIHSFIVSIATQ